MPSERAPGRKPISLWLDDDLLELIELARESARVDRSQFVRDAIIRSLRELGYPPEAFQGAVPQPEIATPMIKKTSGKVAIADITAHSGGTNKVTITYKEAPKKVAKEKYADGTIGRDANQRNYIAYLLGRYYEFKKADLSYGADPVEHARIMNGLYPVVNNTIRKTLGAYPNALPQARFSELSEYMHAKIDGTILGKNNRKKGTKNYKTFEEFCALGQG